MELLKRITAILLTPQTEWPVIAQERNAGKGDASALFIHYVAILAPIPALSRFIGASLVGSYAPVLPSMAGGLALYVSSFGIVYGVALIIDALAPRFGVQKDFSGALKLAVYSATPVWLAGFFFIVPGLSFLVVFGLYGAYLLWLGLPILMRAPPEKALSYAVVVAACTLVIVVGLGLVEAPLFGAPG